MRCHLFAVLTVVSLQLAELTHLRVAAMAKGCGPFALRLVRRELLLIVAFVITGFVINSAFVYRNIHSVNRVAYEDTLTVKTVVIAPVRRAYSKGSRVNVPIVKVKYHTSLVPYSEFFVPRLERVTPLDFEFMSATRGPCNSDQPFLIVLVLSMTKNWKLRKAVRETWGSVNRTNTWAGKPLRKPVRVIFVIGMSKNDDALLHESDVYGDIVHVSVQESYHNLTYKVLMGIRWVYHFCREVEFVAKVDEDTFPDVPVFLDILTSVNMTNTIMGPVFTFNKVQRTGKYAVSEASYPAPQFPPHCKGNFYLMPADLAFRILKTAQHLPYDNMEDAHLTGVVAYTIGGVRFRGLTRKQYNIFDPPKVCEYVTGTKTVAQKVDPVLGQEIWKRFNDESLCSKSRNRDH